MIPADLTARLRMLTEASFFEADQPVQALNRITPIPADLPEFAPGQRLTATLQSALPDGLFRAIVAGKTINLALGQKAGADLPQPGQTVALEVTRNTPQAVHAQVIAPQAAAEPPPALSQVGRLISVLLTGQGSTEAAPLAAGRPLLAAPPASGAPLVPVLREALSQSGLFYESHQAEWLAGRLSTAALLREPQGQIPAAPPQPGSPSQPASLFQAASPFQPVPPAPPPGVPATQPEPLGSEAATLRETPPEARAVSGAPAAIESEYGLPHGRQVSEPDTEARPSIEPTRAAAPGTSAIPERLMPLVSQQLDALATQQFAWQGQVWPGQTMDWQIEDPAGGSAGAAPENLAWNTTLRLTLPRLGSVEARLQLTAGGVSVRVLAAETEARTALSAGREALAQGLAAARLPLLGLSVETTDERRADEQR